ncbi:MAG: outer membrane beta-barrel protein [Gemmatimonadales bacterium]
MNTRLSVTCAVTLLLLLGAPAWAQNQGTIEAGAYAQLNNYDNSLNLDNALGVGGRVGVFVLRGLAIEAGVSRTSTGGVTHTPVRASLAYSVPAGSAAEIVVGAGYVRNKYGGTVDVSEDGVSGFLGLRAHVRSALAVRIDAVLDYVGRPANQVRAVPYNGNLGLHVGVSWLVNPLGRATR